MMGDGWVCPECAQGKHQNCDGTAWDEDADELTMCSCPDTATVSH